VGRYGGLIDGSAPYYSHAVFGATPEGNGKVENVI
jgi:hypothetical protein